MNFDNLSQEELKDQLSLQIQLVQRQSAELGNLTTQNISLGLTLDLKKQRILELEKALEKALEQEVPKKK